VARVDLRALARHVANPQHLRYFLDTDFREHYRLIAYLSTRFNNSLLFDIGTNKGYSALALSYNPTNRVISYDIEECKELNAADQLSRIEFRLGDVLTDSRLLSAPLIMLNTNHDGSFERVFYDFLKKHHYHN
jgi:predicted O-methyltransferase YrrM